jgi:hypothetical protein
MIKGFWGGLSRMRGVISSENSSLSLSEHRVRFLWKVQRKCFDIHLCQIVSDDNALSSP